MRPPTCSLPTACTRTRSTRHRCTVSTGWWGEHSDEDAIRLLREAYDLGITLFDTADTYGEGRGETLVARALGHVRDRITIATKFGYDIYSPWERKGHVERPHDWSP